MTRINSQVISMFGGRQSGVTTSLITPTRAKLSAEKEIIMEYLGHGRMRNAFRFGNIVLKFPRNFAGVKACFEEMVLWIHYRSEAMAPVLFGIPGICVAMPYYAEPFAGPKPESFIKALNRFGIVDLHPYNLRMHNGRPIAIDYAVNYNSGGQGEPTGGW